MHDDELSTSCCSRRAAPSPRGVRGRAGRARGGEIRGAAPARSAPSRAARRAGPRSCGGRSCLPPRPRSRSASSRSSSRCGGGDGPRLAAAAAARRLPGARADAATASARSGEPAPGDRPARRAGARSSLRPARRRPQGRAHRRASTLGTDPDRVDDVAQGVLGVVARYDAIVDQSSVQSSTAGGEAHFELRIPADRLQPALAALSRLPDAHVLSRTDDTRDVNQAYVSVRRRLANARAERAGVIRALANADTRGRDAAAARAARRARAHDRAAPSGRSAGSTAASTTAA